MKYTLNKKPLLDRIPDFTDEEKYFIKYTTCAGLPTAYFVATAPNPGAYILFAGIGLFCTWALTECWNMAKYR